MGYGNQLTLTDFMQITPREAFRKELRFNLRVWKRYKPIAPSSEQNSPTESSDEDQNSDEINLHSAGNGKLNRSNIFND